MNKTDSELEKLFRYRFIQVLYLIGLILSFCFIFVLALIMCPKEYLNMEKSKAICLDRKTYTFITANITDPLNHYSHYFWQSDVTTTLSDDDRQKLEMLCIDSLLTSSGKIWTQYYNQLKQSMHEETPSTQQVLRSMSREQLLMLLDAKTIQKKISQNTESGKPPLFSVNSIKNLLFTYDSSREALFWFVLFLFLLEIFLYASLNIIREALIYLFIGRKFTWQWLRFYKKNSK